MADDETTPETVDVWVVWAYDEATDGPDTARINTVESVTPDVARQMIQSGEARGIDDPRNIDDGYRPDPVDDPDVDLPSLTKEQLRDMLPGGPESLPQRASKDDLIAAIEAGREEQQAAEGVAPTPDTAVAADHTGDSTPAVTDMTTEPSTTTDQ